MLINEGTGGCTVLIFILLLNLFVGGFAVRYPIEFWKGYQTEEIQDIPFLPCAIAGLFLGEIAVPISLATWLGFDIWVDDPSDWD